MMKMGSTCCALTRLEPIMLKAPSAACLEGCPGGGSVVACPYANPKKREEMYSEEEKDLIDKDKERKEKRKGTKTRWCSREEISMGPETGPKLTAADSLGRNIRVDTRT